MDGSRKQPGGMMIKYKVHNNVLVIYAETPVLSEYVAKSYPQQKNIAPVKADGNMGGLEIKMFDDDVFGILSKIPDDEKNWSELVKFTKSP
jgi:hypothetical protein